MGVGDVSALDGKQAILHAIGVGGADGVLARVRHIDHMLSPESLQGTTNDTAMPANWRWDSLKETTSATPAPSPDSIRRLGGGQWQRVAMARAFLRAGHADLVGRL